MAAGEIIYRMRLGLRKNAPGDSWRDGTCSERRHPKIISIVNGILIGRTVKMTSRVISRSAGGGRVFAGK